MVKSRVNTEASSPSWSSLSVRPPRILTFNKRELLCQLLSVRIFYAEHHPVGEIHEILLNCACSSSSVRFCLSLCFKLVLAINPSNRHISMRSIMETPTLAFLLADRHYLVTTPLMFCNSLLLRLARSNADFVNRHVSAIWAARPPRGNHLQHAWRRPAVCLLPFKLQHQQVTDVFLRHQQERMGLICDNFLLSARHRRKETLISTHTHSQHVLFNWGL